MCCLPAPGTLCCRSWPSSSLGHWCAAGVQQKTSQSTPGGCVLQEVNFLQIRIDKNRNLGVSRVTQSNLKYELISQLERVSTSCFSLVLHYASYIMWKINRHQGDPVLDINNISSLPLGHISFKGTGKGTPYHSQRLWLPSDCGVTAA